MGEEHVHHDPVLLTLHGSLLLGLRLQHRNRCRRDCRFEHQHKGPGSPRGLCTFRDQDCGLFVIANKRGDTTAALLTAAATHFAELGIRIERVMTDNAKGYVESRAFQAALVSIGATHKRTRSYRPPTNGTAEAFIWTLRRAWAS